MGYILPITHYNYKQYQNRMKETEESPHYIHSPYRTVFHRIDSEYNENEQTMYRDHLKEVKPTPEKRQPAFYYISKHQKAQLTGKGGMINERT